MWLGGVGIRSEGFGADLSFLTRLSRVLEGEVSRRIGVCLRSQPSKVNGRKPMQMAINEGLLRDLKFRSRKRV